MAENGLVRTFAIQVEPVATGMTPQAKSTAFAEVSTEKLQEIGDFIQRVAEHLTQEIQNNPFAPTEFAIEFGVGLKGDASIPFLVKGSVETNFKVSAKWDLKGKR